MACRWGEGGVGDRRAGLDFDPNKARSAVPVAGLAVKRRMAAAASLLPHPQVNGTLGGRRGAPGAELAFSGAAGVNRLTVFSPLRRQRVKPDAKLTALTWGLRPSEVALEPVDKAAAEGGDASGSRAARPLEAAVPPRPARAAKQPRFPLHRLTPLCSFPPTALALQPPRCATCCPTGGPSTACC
jgi:hypothetical protein